MNYRRWQAVHKWSSLVPTVFLLLLCLTGLPLIFAHEIDELTGNAVALPPAPAAAAASLEAIVADALRRRPGEVLRFATRDDEEPLWFLSLGHAAASGPTTALLTYDARTGELLRDRPLRLGFMWLMVRLHTDLFAGLAGTLLLGAMGALLLVALVSGVAVYGPSMRRLAFATVRRDRAPRLAWLDLHNLLGIVTLTWLAVVAATGVLLTLAKPVYGQWQEAAIRPAAGAAAAAPPVDGAHTASLDRVAAAALAHGGGGRQIAFIAYPGTRWAAADRFTVFLRGDSALTARIIEPVFVDARQARALGGAAMPAHVFLLRISGPLHFGDYGGLPLKLLWAALDIAAIAVLASGLWLWWRRR